MRKILSIIFLISFTSCASYKSRNQIYTSDIDFRGGVSGDQVWEDSLVFERISWFYDATVKYEILLSKLDQSSPFASWLGADRLNLTTCENFYIGILYTDINAQHGTSFLVSQLSKSGLTEHSVLAFSYNIKAHQNFKDWKLDRHKILGFCSKSKSEDGIQVTIPGYQTHKIL